ncbi:MAG: TIGR03915 family putative DNA repair protein [Clostridiales Family XIII bacterium]|jgi:probable DNA metabolism protein|nr:TIGR03915 family putative DNA repair protein [Clostridiales Family XIII bacterium]
MDYLYDESFEGFLCCVYRHYYGERASGIFPAGRYQHSLLNACETVPTDEGQAGRVYAALRDRLSRFDPRRIYLVFRSSAPEKEMKLLDYIRLGFKEGPKTGLLYGNPVVRDVRQAEDRVVREVHRMCGLLRFSEVRPRGAAPGHGGAILYAPMEPDHDITEFLARHFCDRFREEAFIIHDRRRGKALVSAAGRWYMTDFGDEWALAETGAETRYRELWRGYFDAVAIKERANPACQRRFMPLRYWKHITETVPYFTSSN